jgi:hypothetical protein
MPYLEKCKQLEEIRIREQNEREETFNLVYFIYFLYNMCCLRKKRNGIVFF